MSSDLEQNMASVIGRIATGPDLSKDVSQEEARLGMAALLEEAVDPVRAGIFLIALRMKRETREEFRGILQAILDATQRVEAGVDEVVDICDPYNGLNRTLPASPFIAPLLAECGVHVVTHGLESVGPKYGITHRHVLAAAGLEVELTPQQAAARLADESLGWSYLDQSRFAPKLHRLVELRRLMIKRSAVTTTEILAMPITGRNKTHFISGYVHKPYPPIYADLARFAGFDSALFIRGVEGSIMPSLRQPGRYYAYHEKGEESAFDIDPATLGIEQPHRCVPIPEGVPQTDKGEGAVTVTDIPAGAAKAAELGRAALTGEKGPTYDSLVYTGSLILQHLGKTPSIEAAADWLRGVLDSGKAAERLR